MAGRDDANARPEAEARLTAQDDEVVRAVDAFPSYEAPSARPRASWLSLAQLTAQLGPDIVKIACAPKGVDVRISDVVISDPEDPSPLQTEDLVLGVGIGSHLLAAQSLIQAAGLAGCTAVAIKMTATAPLQIVSAAQLAQVALIWLPRELAWGQFYALANAAIARMADSGLASIEPGPAGDLFGIANAVAAALGGAVEIEDAQDRVLAYSTLGHPIDEPRRQSILGRRVPSQFSEGYRRQGITQRLRSSDDVVEIEGIPGLRQPRRAISIRIGSRVLGSIWAIQGDKQFGPSERAALVDAARMATLFLSQDQTRSSIARRHREQVIRGVFEGTGRHEEALAELGSTTGTRFTAISFEIQPSGIGDADFQRTEALKVIDLHAAMLSRRSITLPFGGLIYSVVPHAQNLPRQRVLATAQRVLENAATRGIRLRAGVGSAVDDVSALPQTRREAEQAVRVTPYGSALETVAFEDAFDRILLRDAIEAVGPIRGPVGKLATLSAHDRQHGTAYMLTLRAFLDHFGDARAAADSQSIPENTFRYRLRRLLEVSSIRLDRPDERLAIELQLRSSLGRDDQSRAAFQPED